MPRVSAPSPSQQTALRNHPSWEKDDDTNRELRPVIAKWLGTKLYSDWGVTYTTAAQFCSTLNRCDVYFSIDISDAHHLSLWAGCCGELRPIKWPIITSRGPRQPNEVLGIDAMVNGCTPSNCHGGRQGPERIRDRLFRVQVRRVPVRPEDSWQPSLVHRPRSRSLLRELDRASPRCCLEG